MVKMRRTTIRDVAEAAEVSPSTVSMVLNNSERSFSDEVRQRVLKAAKSLKYVPNGVGRPSISEGRKSRSMRPKLAFLTYPSSSSAGETLYGMVQKGAEFECIAHKVDLVSQNTTSFMLSSDIVGVFTYASSSSGFKHLINNKPSITCMSKIRRNIAEDHVTYNNAEIAVLAAEYLLKKGHKHIGFIPLDNSEMFLERSKVFESVIVKSGKKHSHPLPMDHADLFDNPANLEKLLYDYLSRPDRPTALFIPADTVTSLAYPMLYSMGIIPGKDIEVVTCNNEFLRIAGLMPRPTVIDIRAFDVGRYAAIQLLNRLKHPDAPQLKLEIMPTLIEGKDWDRFIKKSYYYR